MKTQLKYDKHIVKPPGVEECAVNIDFQNGIKMDVLLPFERQNLLIYIKRQGLGGGLNGLIFFMTA